jgi:imidazole glycerol phosphate synthase glutamine amidotransferase subunit
MKQKIGLIDYGYAGNTFNIKKAVLKVAPRAELSEVKTAKDLHEVDKIILPGVGAYRDVMHNLADLAEDIAGAIKKKPTLGICLGMQILSQKGYEFGETRGLGIFEGEVMRIPVKCRVPHLGWAPLDILRESRILNGVKKEDSFYFMHSYEFMNYKDLVSLSVYGEHQFVSVVEKGHVFGVQFHPEKSREAGLKVLENFINF